ncbi:hypothetical protein [Flavobacterium sp.]|uniref:hypothetical protein n=1 Tax=Flavobacterium sp. TaxID=239 RepID=UPI0039E51480
MKYTLLLIGILLLLFFGMPDVVLYAKSGVLKWVPYGIIILVVPFLLYKILDGMKINSTLGWLIPIGSVLMVGIPYGHWTDDLKEKDLQQNGAVTDGVVVDVFEGSRESYHKLYFVGEFEVDGKTYQTFSYDNKDHRFQIDDSIVVEYSRRNPENSRVILD